MTILNKLRQILPPSLFSLKETEPEDAYNTWSQYYDAQPDNLMLALDEAIFKTLFAKVDFHNKIIADIGCGTGRHWKKMYAKQPSRIIGYDVSEGMLKVLKNKYPEAETHHLKTNHLAALENGSCDIIISNLAIAHIQDFEDAFTEWSCVLKTDGHIIITDYHPDTLSKGGNRTFRHNGRLIAVKNYIHPIIKIMDIASKLNFKVDDFTERKIDDSVKHYYEKQQAIKVFERFKGTSIIYGAHLTRKNAAK
jgi:ubiquinone/menaquinone biosynthesis C-methylase UbiE